MKKIQIFLFSVCLVFTSFVGAQTQDKWTPVTSQDQSNLITNYKNFTQIQDLKIVVPTVIEISIPADQITTGRVDVFNKTTNEFVYSTNYASEKPGPYVTSVSSTKSIPDLIKFFDNNVNTGANLYLSNNSSSDQVEFNITYSENLKSSLLVLRITDSNLLPDYITISAEENGVMRTLVNNRKITSSTINFPSVSSKKWSVRLSYSQPFKLNEISIQDSTNEISKKIIRFLAQPSGVYEVYANTDVTFKGPVFSSYPNLNTLNGVKNIGLISLISNEQYRPMDTDGDGIPNVSDNCPSISNVSQVDVNKNNIGDECDDYDQDLVINSKDNCMNVANPTQKDTDGDKIGDACDADESRFTEKYPIIIWGILGGAAFVFIALLAVVANKIKNQNSVQNSGNVVDNNSNTDTTVK